MKAITVSVLSEASNVAVVQFPGRKYPSILVQGDSLAILYMLAKEVSQTFDRSIGDEVFPIDELVDLLQGYLRSYETALKKYDMETPYGGSLWVE